MKRCLNRGGGGPRCDTWMLVTKNSRISCSPNSALVSSIKFIVVNLKGGFTRHGLRCPNTSKNRIGQMGNWTMDLFSKLIPLSSLLRQRALLLGWSLFSASSSMSPALELQAMIISQIKSVSNTITSVSLSQWGVDSSKCIATVGDKMENWYDTIVWFRNVSAWFYELSILQWLENLCKSLLILVCNLWVVWETREHGKAS